MLRNPQLYGVGIDESESDPQLAERRADLAHSAAMLLDKHNLIKYDRKTGNLQATDLGRIASAFYVTYNTLATFNDHLRPTMVRPLLYRDPLPFLRFEQWECGDVCHSPFLRLRTNAHADHMQ